MFFLFRSFEENCCDSFILIFHIESYELIVQAIILVVGSISDLHMHFLKSVSNESQILLDLHRSNWNLRSNYPEFKHRFSGDLESIICKITNQNTDIRLLIHERVVCHASSKYCSKSSICFHESDYFSELCFCHRILGYHLNLFFLFAHVLLNIPAQISLRNTDHFGLW